MNVSAHVASLRDQGFCVLPAQYSTAQVQTLRAGIEDIYDELAPPALHSKTPQEVAPDVELSGTGLVIKKVLGRRREFPAVAVDATIVDIIKGALGPGAHIEMSAAVVADHTRPFFEWHDHLGGIDEELYRRRGERPQVPTLQRIAMIVYLETLDEAAGQLLVYPKRNEDGSVPCDLPRNSRWPGDIVVGGPPGTTVLIDQTTWHAALPRTASGLRIFFGLWFAAGDVGRTEIIDESLQNLDAPPLLAAVLPPSAT